MHKIDTQSLHLPSPTTDFGRVDQVGSAKPPQKMAERRLGEVHRWRPKDPQSEVPVVPDHGGIPQKTDGHRFPGSERF